MFRTYDLIRDVVVGELAVEVGGLVDVQPGVDLDLEVFPVWVVELALGVVDLDRLPLLSAEAERVRQSVLGSADGRLKGFQ